MRLTNFLIIAPTMAGDEEKFAILEALKCLYQPFSTAIFAWEEQAFNQEKGTFCHLTKLERPVLSLPPGPGGSGSNQQLV